MASSVSGRSAAKSKVAKAPQKALSLKEKYDVIETSKKNPGMAVRALAAKFGCGRSQINSILENKESIIELYESNRSSTSVLSRKRCRESDFSEVNEALYSWYLLATSRNIYPGGPQLVKKQSKFADELDISHFKASNGWLVRWKTCHNVKQPRVCGEHLLEGYSSNNIYNLDETGMLSLKVALESREFNVTVERSQSTGLLWCSL